MGESFIAAARARGAGALLGPFLSAGRFDSSLAGALTVERLDTHGAWTSFRVEERHCNAFHTLHGGCVALLVDVVGTLALLGRDPLRPGVSVEMNQTFVRAARAGDVLHCRGHVIKTGARLGFTEGKRASDGVCQR